MLRVARRVSRGTPSDVLSLPYEERKKSRLRVTSERGQDVAIMLERGSTLRDGDLLAADGGEVLAVRAAAERVSEVSSADGLALTRVAYHLGNRHVPLQIEAGVLRYQHDHVLDGMVRELGLEVGQRMAAFEPERGAYAHGGHGRVGHEDAHAHAHGYEDVHVDVDVDGRAHADEPAHAHDHKGGQVAHSHAAARDPGTRPSARRMSSDDTSPTLRARVDSSSEDR